MSLNPNQKKWNIVFLVDQKTPTRIILLKRGAAKDFAPNWYTGIGGKIGDLPGTENETPLESAYRELSEETLGAVTQKNTKLTEFARLIYSDNGIILYYFFATYNGNPPPVDPVDGSLEWVSTSDLLSKNIIPSTHSICSEWSKRNFSTSTSFTVFVHETGHNGTVRLIELEKVEEGLK